MPIYAVGKIPVNDVQLIEKMFLGWYPIV